MKNFSTISHQSIRRHPTNNSPSKMSLKFSQTKRFKDPNPECPHSFYQQSKNLSSLSQRKSSIGYGEKYDFTKTLTTSPAPTKYQIKSSIQQIKFKGRTFGCSREKSQDRSYLVPQLQKVPGPGNYENKKQTRSTISFSMRPKTQDNYNKSLTFWKNPAPNAYQSINLVPQKGRFLVSKYSDAKFSIINPNSQRFEKIKQMPGPAQYHEKDSLNREAKYILSNHRGNGTRAFARTARKKLWAVNETPGPGQYKETSQFGLYGDAKFYKTLTTFKSAQI